MKPSEEIALSWLKKAKTEQDHFDQFVSLWFALNALYNQFFEGSEGGALNNLVFSSQYRLNNAKTFKILNSKNAMFFTKRIIRDCRGNRIDTAEWASKLKNKGSYPRNRLWALIRILYQVRCNLFHGNKMYERDSDQQVVSKAAAVLMLILNAYLIKST